MSPPKPQVAPPHLDPISEFLICGMALMLVKPLAQTLPWNPRRRTSNLQSCGQLKDCCAWRGVNLTRACMPESSIISKMPQRQRGPSRTSHSTCREDIWWLHYNVKGIVTDRKCLPFSYPASAFEGDQALADLRRFEENSDGRRKVLGDRYGKPKRKAVLCKSLPRWPCWGWVCPVLLEDVGLLSSHSHILGHHPFPAGPLWEGLVMDDYFAISTQAVSADGLPLVAKCFSTALDAYEKEKVLGSTEKDVLNTSHFKVIGAEVNSGKGARSRGVVCVSAPVTKRLSLIALSLRAAVLPITSRGLISRLQDAGPVCSFTGGVSGMCALRHISAWHCFRWLWWGGFDFASSCWQWDRFGFCFWIDSCLRCISALWPYDKTIYATDASMIKGAVVSREVGTDTAKAFWLGGDKKGAYTKLDNPFRAIHSGPLVVMMTNVVKRMNCLTAHWMDRALHSHQQVWLLFWFWFVWDLRVARGLPWVWMSVLLSIRRIQGVSTLRATDWWSGSVTCWWLEK